MKAMILKITPEILRLIAEIDEFKGEWQALKALAPDRLVALKRVSTIESVGSSTRIEGVKLTDSEIEKLLSGLKIQPFGSRDEEEVAGYAALMETVFESFENITLDENHIKQLHRVLLKYSSKDVRHLGEYKKFPNRVEAFDSEGKSLGVVFEPASPFETPSRMKELLEWFNDEENVKDLHPLLRISVFVIWFLAIHPFQDGNGRLSRALTTLLLLQNGYAYVPFSSLERIVEENKDRYYQFLRRGQKSLYTDQETLNDWIVFFLHCLKKQKDVLEKKIEGEKKLMVLPELSLKILEAVRAHGSLGIGEVVSILGAKRGTVKVHLNKLIELGYLKKSGVGRGTVYSL